MGHFSDKPDSVRVDFFKADDIGRPWKWYCTEAIIWRHYSGQLDKGGHLIHDAFAAALISHLRGADGRIRLNGMLAVCLEPYHEHAHPLAMYVAMAVAIVDRNPALLAKEAG